MSETHFYLGLCVVLVILNVCMIIMCITNRSKRNTENPRCLKITCPLDKHSKCDGFAYRTDNNGNLQCNQKM